MAWSSLLLALLNIVVLWGVAGGRRWGWLLGLLSQLPWTIYDLWSRQPGFLLLTVIYVPIYWRGHRGTRRQR